MERGLTGAANKTPAQMGATGGAEGDLPGVAGKPGELGAGGIQSNRTGRGLKTADLKGNARRIEKGVLVVTVHGHSQILAGDAGMADAAQQAGMLVIGGLVLRHGYGHPAHLGRSQQTLTAPVARLYCDRRQQWPAPYHQW